MHDGSRAKILKVTAELMMTGRCKFNVESDWMHMQRTLGRDLQSERIARVRISVQKDKHSDAEQQHVSAC